MLRKVLLVEDHDNARILLGNFLSEKFEVTGARNGLEAMTWLHKGLSPDIIITDNEMPEMDGNDLIRQLRCTGLWSDIPVIVLSQTNSGTDAAGYFKSLGVSECFTKPFNPLALQEKILQIVH